MPIFGAKSRAARGCASKLACGRRIDPAEHNCKIANPIGKIVKRPVGRTTLSARGEIAGLPQRIVKTGVRRAGRARHRPLQTLCGFAGMHSFLQVHTAGRTEASAPTGAYRSTLVQSNFQHCAARAGQAPPLRYDETWRQPRMVWVLIPSGFASLTHLPLVTKGRL